MKNSQHIQKEVDETFNSLDGIQRAQANPFLFTRIKEKMTKRETGVWGMAISIISRPVFAVAAIVLIVLINLAIFFQNQPEPIQTSTQDGEQLFASEYNLGGVTMYDENMDQQ
jgi:hypothetical protein